MPTLPRVQRTKLMTLQPNEYHLVAFDPGGTIGWAHFIVDFKAFSRPEHKVLRYLKSWDCGEFNGTEIEQITEASSLIARAHHGVMPYTSTTDVISEDFELTQLIGGKNLLSPVRINAVLEWICHERGLKLTLQARQMRTQVTQERLELFGFQPPGKQWTKTGKGKDMFAAMQHGLVWLRRIKDASRSRPWKLADRISSNAKWDCACEQGKRCDLEHLR